LSKTKSLVGRRLTYAEDGGGGIPLPIYLGLLFDISSERMKVALRTALLDGSPERARKPDERIARPGECNDLEAHFPIG
jgi:hypothetical protein